MDAVWTWRRPGCGSLWSATWSDGLISILLRGQGHKWPAYWFQCKVTYRKAAEQLGGSFREALGGNFQKYRRESGDVHCNVTALVTRGKACIRRESGWVCPASALCPPPLPAGHAPAARGPASDSNAISRLQGLWAQCGHAWAAPRTWLG